MERKDLEPGTLIWIFPGEYGHIDENGRPRRSDGQFVAWSLVEHVCDDDGNVVAS